MKSAVLDVCLHFLSGYSIRIPSVEEDIDAYISQKTGISPNRFTLKWFSTDNCYIVVQSCSPNLELDDISYSFAWDFLNNPLIGMWENVRNNSRCEICRHKVTKRLFYKEPAANVDKTDTEYHGFLVPFEVTEGKLWWEAGLRCCLSVLFCPCHSSQSTEFIGKVFVATDNLGKNLIIKNKLFDETEWNFAYCRRCSFELNKPE